jgi:hypothetical protein
VLLGRRKCLFKRTATCDVPSGQEQEDNIAVESLMFMTVTFCDNFRVILVDLIPSTTIMIADISGSIHKKKASYIYL